MNRACRKIIFACTKHISHTRKYQASQHHRPGLSNRPYDRLAMYYFWAVVLFIGVAHRLFAAVVHYTTRRTYQDPEAGSRIRSNGKQGGIRRLVRRYITLPATFGYKHQQPFGWCTLPTRITSILVFIFIAINVVLSSVVYRSTPDYL